MKFILGQKLGMSQVFEDDKVIPVTLIEAGPCKVVQIKTKEKEGYSGVQIGFGKKKRLTKPLKGHFKKIPNSPSTSLRAGKFKVQSSITSADDLFKRL